MNCAGIMSGSERGYPAGDIERDRAQELGQLAHNPRIKAAIGAVSEARDNPNRLL
jgi:hypothetical protein